ncbi:arsenate reductase family protein [Listeria sp. FSL L7-1485]|uniref:Arsenate reductase family protein n=1 Tax=Listeria immobilis TaxID=2713502 RepID=A0A7X1C8E0_9LIST|nr:arsenate reductase family protein [Listeria immobilis]MBC1482526.1 arsenate reductase family protein [Listeria immobilis]MBC1488193.1 arsenate reductase family protein [Listeria immobilis]MBC1507881.1 arsenate reductase family protein [Listeria immobilis]MBC1509788.1 arsenate reductase family protein [Listeria immobilis]MBC1516958.1 arsenate reductase family protein [Listeria immobilis]
MINFYWYPKCSTCKKAKAWLENEQIEFTEMDIKTETPSAEELQAWHELSGLPIRRFFNTSGIKYRELGLKDKIDTMSLKEAYEILASDGMLIKRPLTTNGKVVTLGFNEPEFEATWK